MLAGLGGVINVTSERNAARGLDKQQRLLREEIV